MKKYMEAELEIIYFAVEDVIATSSELPTDPDELPLVPVG